MELSAYSKQYQEKMFPGCPSSLASLKETDPEFYERFANFAFDEVVQSGQLDDRTRKAAPFRQSPDLRPCRDRGGCSAGPPWCWGPPR